MYQLRGRAVPGCEGQTSCIKCVVGKFAGTAQMTVCAECEAGMYAVEEGTQTCIDCVAGQYQAAKAQTSCIKCVVGKVAGTATTNTCSSAGTNTACSGKVDPANSLACTSESIGTCTGSAGAEAACDAVVAAEDGKESTCVGTIVGTCTGSAGADATCDAVVAAQGGKEATCVGTVGISGGACAWTSVGACAWTPANACTWNNNANTACTECDAGQYNSVVELYNAETGATTQEGGAGPCIDCVVGQYQAEKVQTSCIKCVVGKVAATAKMTACTDCEAGEYFAEEGGAVPCIDCLAGQYQAETVQASCIKCVAGKSRRPRKCLRAQTAWSASISRKRVVPDRAVIVRLGSTSTSRRRTPASIAPWERRAEHRRHPPGRAPHARPESLRPRSPSAPLLIRMRIAPCWVLIIVVRPRRTTRATQPSIKIQTTPNAVGVAKATPCPSDNTFVTVGGGGYGGACTCPDGTVYQVGDNGDACGSLACVGGVSGACNAFNGDWTGNKVTCAPENPNRILCSTPPCYDYTSTITSGVCQSCAVGFYQDLTEQTECNSCTNGQGETANRQACAGCEAGKYSKLSTSKQPQICTSSQASGAGEASAPAQTGKSTGWATLGTVARHCSANLV